MIQKLSEDGTATEVRQRDSDGRPPGNAKHSQHSGPQGEDECLQPSTDAAATITTAAPLAAVARPPPPPPASVHVAMEEVLAQERRKAVTECRKFRDQPSQSSNPSRTAAQRNRRPQRQSDHRQPDVLAHTALHLQPCDPIALCTAVQGISARDSPSQHERGNIIAAQLCDTAIRMAQQTATLRCDEAQQFCIHSDDETPRIASKSNRASFIDGLRSNAATRSTTATDSSRGERTTPRCRMPTSAAVTRSAGASTAVNGLTATGAAANSLQNAPIRGDRGIFAAIRRLISAPAMLPSAQTSQHPRVGARPTQPPGS